jgi:hypothetical protein
MMGKTSIVHPLRWLIVLMMSLLWATVGSAAALAERGDLEHCGIAAKTLPTATQPNRIYSARELIRRADEPGPFHNFPESFNKQIFESGNRTVTPDFFNKARQGLSNDSI